MSKTVKPRSDGAPTPPTGLDADYIEPGILAAVGALTETLSLAEHAEARDLGIIVIPIEGSLQIAVGESDDFGVVQLDDGSHLIGWVQPNDSASWVFVPCLPHLGWSIDKNRWVPMDEIRAANVARREAAS